MIGFENGEPWAIRRLDGRTNAQVLADMIKEASPGDVFEYDRIARELSKGTETTYDRPKVQSIVATAIPFLEKVHRRTLTNVRGVGYRIAPASEHVSVSSQRHARANRQFRKGLHTLEHVRWEEMDENARRAHEGHLILASALYQQTQSLERRLSRVESAIAKIPGVGG